MSKSSQLRSPCDITIAVPTYNGGKRLPLLLDRLKTQSHTENLRWEVLIVDNNSQDDTAEVVRQYQAHWLPQVPLRYAFEPRQGAAFARQAAVLEAAGDIIGFLDDDNLPEPNWVAEAVDFSRRYPQAGAFSGRIRGSYEVNPPEGFEQIKQFLAIRDHGDQVIEFEPAKLRLPPAASLVVRKAAWLSCVPAEPTMTGRLPGLFIQGEQGEDYEVLLHLHKGDWKIFYDPELVAYHQIPQQRFNRDYLLTLARDSGLATCQLSLINAENWQKPYIVVRTFLGSLRRLLHHILQSKGQVNADLSTAFTFQFYLGSLMSPLYVRRWN